MNLTELDENEFYLTTKRLLLEPTVVEHTHGLWPHMSNPEISSYLAWSPHPDEVFCKRVIEGLYQNHVDGTARHWTIFYQQEICGLISLIDIRRTHLTWILNRCELAYWIAPAYQNLGLISEACETIIQFAFNTCQFHKVIVAHASDNIASEKVIKKLNFNYIGEEVDAFCKKDKWYNLKHYELINK